MKKLSKIFLMLILCFISANINIVSAAEIKPQITFVGIGHSPLVQGDTETFFITSDSSKKVQYKVFLNDDVRMIRSELTEGYSELTNSKIPYEIASGHIFELGKYRLEIWVKEEGSLKEYDNTYIAYLNCVSKDDKNRVYANGDMNIEKNVYHVGEKVVINGIKDIGGIGGGYLYRLHIFSPDKISNEGFGFDSKGWAKNVTRYENTIEWTPMEAGTYVLDVHAITPKSVLWKNVKSNKDIIYGGYEAWKLKTITVMGEPLKSVKEEDIKEFIGSEEYKGNINPEEFRDVNGKIYMNLLGSQHYDAENHKTVYDTVLPIETYNKDINKQSYALIKSLVDRECYISSGINRFDVQTLGPFVDIGLEDKLLGSQLFKYVLYEGDSPYTPEGTKIRLIVNQLASSNTWNDIVSSKVKNKFEASLKAIYGKETGYKIYNYILNDYISYKSSGKPYIKEVIIDNVKMSISTDFIYNVCFIF